ncbi:MAG: phage protein Gp37 [Terriglobia bacterium]
MKLAEIEDALLDTVQTAAALNYLRTVETISERTFDFARADFVVVPPAVLSFFVASEMSARDLQRQTYSYHPRFLLFAIARNLRGLAEEKKGGPGASEIGAYQILHDLKTTLAGKRLTLASSSFTPVCELAGESLEAFTTDFSVYALDLIVQGTFHV